MPLVYYVNFKHYAIKQIGIRKLPVEIVSHYMDIISEMIGNLLSRLEDFINKNCTLIRNKLTLLLTSCQKTNRFKNK